MIPEDELEIGELRLLEVERRRLRSSFEIDLQVCVVAMDSHGTDIFQLKNYLWSSRLDFYSI